MNTPAPSTSATHRQTSRYYSAFRFVAPMDCTDCPSCDHLDEEDANDIATFLVGGMANRVAIESSYEVAQMAVAS